MISSSLPRLPHKCTVCHSQSQGGTQFHIENPLGLKRRPVEVKVHKIHPQPPYRTDINNNQARLIVHPANQADSAVSPVTQSSSFFGLPPVSLCFAIVQVALYASREAIGVTSEEVVYVSWRTVITEREFWRLLYAHYFHFGRVHMFFNIVTLMGIGRYLEKKIRSVAFALLIISMSAISNLLYIFMNDTLCSGPHNDYTVGFSTVMFSLRMIHIFTMDSEANNGKGDPSLIFGFLPVYLPPYISPWLPVIETFFFDIFVIGRCVATTVSGMCAALLFPYLMRNYRNYIMLPHNPPPLPPKYLPRRRTSHSHSVKDEYNNNSDDDITDDMNANTANYNYHND